jgi:plasmid stabilization system protein ParE
VEYVAGSSIAAAGALRDQVGVAEERLGVYPRLGRTVPEFSDPSIRELIVGTYRLIYRIDDDMIFIIPIIHGSRDLRRHLPEGPWDIQ